MRLPSAVLLAAALFAWSPAGTALAQETPAAPATPAEGAAPETLAEPVPADETVTDAAPEPEPAPAGEEAAPQATPETEAVTEAAAPVEDATPSVPPVHGMAMHGDVAYPADFTHFAYVNPEAPKGGNIRLSAFGTFDTLNPYTLKGNSADGLGLTMASLTVASADEPFSKYGQIAESMELPEDRTWIIFNLREEARWSDGEPITADDVAFSLKTLREKGSPLFGSYYADVTDVQVLGPRRVKFVFKNGDNRELPLILGDLPILPKHYWEGREFADTTLEPPVSSGPYRITSFEPGREITYERVADWWGKDLPVSKGLYNFDTIRYDFYRDLTVSFEAFKAGAYDYRSEMNSKNWARGYDVPARQSGDMVLEAIPHNRTQGMQGFYMNQRRALFADPKVREALAYAFDFQWTNENLFFGQNTRTRSYFDNSELAATGLPSEEELKILEPFRDQIPARVFTEEYNPPSVETAEGGLRGNLRKALELLGEAGWTVTDGALRNAEGQPFAFEVLLVQADFERIVLPYTQNLKRLGIDVSVRTVDTSQYINRVQQFDFDMMVINLAQSDSPGNEQREFWSSAAADIPGSRNYAGFKNPAVDAIIEQVISAPTREALVTRVRALDRILQWSFLSVPQWHRTEDWVAYWNIFGHPAVTPEQGMVFSAWWYDAEKAAAVKGLKNSR